MTPIAGFSDANVEQLPSPAPSPSSKRGSGYSLARGSIHSLQGTREQLVYSLSRLGPVGNLTNSRDLLHSDDLYAEMKEKISYDNEIEPDTPEGDKEKQRF